MVTDAVQGHVVKWPAGMHPVDQAGTWFKMPLYQWQVDVLKAAAEPYSRVVVSTNNESGKMQPVDTMIPTPCGWKHLGELKKYDRVFAMDGSVTRITHIFENGERDIYRIHFDNGEVSTCAGKEHLWLYLTKGRRHNKYGTQNSFQTFTTEQIIEKQGFDSDSQHSGAIPNCGPVQYGDRRFVISPYVMGVLIGDGGLTSSTVKISCADKEILQRVSSELPSQFYLHYASQYDYDIRKIKHSPNTKHIIRDHLKKHGLYGKHSHEKHIPEEYLYAGVEQRINLLRGLMDTDGTVSKRCCHTTFSTTSERLANDVCLLVRGLGGKAKRRSRFTHYSYKGEKKTGRRSYLVEVKLPTINPFYLKRKADRWYPITISPHRLVGKIEYVGKAKCRCIKVDHPTETYLCNDYIVTHNTSCVGPIFILSAMMAFPGARCFATSGSEEQIRAQFFETNLLPIIRPLQAYGWKVWTGDSGRVLAPNGSTLLCYVCKDANKAEGFHAGFNSATGLYEPCVYLSDESKEVKDGIHEAIRRINPTFFLGMSSPGENNWFSRGINQEQLKVIVEQRGGEDTPQRLRYKALAEKILED